MPIGMPTLFDMIEVDLVAALQPLLRPFDEDGLKQIDIEAFSSAEDIAVLLQNFRTRIPGAYLSIPTVTYDSDKEVRAADMTLEYAFLVGTEGVRAKTITKKQAAYYFHDAFHRQLFYKRFVGCDYGANLDFIRPGRFEVSDVDGMLATLTTFSIRVRNWQIRELER